MPEKLPPLVVQLSKLISNVFNPLTALLLYFVYYSFQHYTLGEAARHFIPILIIIIIPVAAWIFWNVKSGRYRDANVSDRKARLSLYFFLEACILAYIFYRYFVDDTADSVFIFLFILLAAMHISNYFIKSSMHTAFNIFVAALFATENVIIGILWFILAMVVGITRIILKRHSVAEVVSGALIAAVISAVYLYLNIQLSY